MAVESFTQAARSVTLETGLKLAYVEQGSPAGIPVILLHGLTDSWRSFRRVLLHLPPSLHVFALSQRGHGDSDRPPRGYTPQDFSNDLAGFMDALDLPRAVIVGHSMGSWAAQRFAIDHPDRVLGLVLAGAFVPRPGNPGLLDLWDSVVSKLTDPIDPAVVREFQVSTLAQDVPPAFLDSVIAESLKVPARVWAHALAPMLEVDFASAIEMVASPTLIVWGDRDSLTSQCDQEILNASIAGSTLAIYSGAGHAVHWEEPSRFAWDVSGFVRKLANGSS